MITIHRPELTNIGKCQIGDGSVIHPCQIYDGVVIGRNCHIQAGALLFDGVTLEDEVFIGPNAVVTNDPDLSVSRDEWVPKKTLIKKGAKIGAGALIRAGVTIGENAIIGMGSVVLKDIPPGETWVGNPAHKI